MESFFRKYYRALCLYAYNLTQDTSASEDLVQDVFVKIIGAGVKFDSDNHFLSYAYRAVRNSCLTYLSDSRKDEKVDMESDSLAKGHPVGAEADMALVNAELTRLIHEAMASLTPRCRQVFRMAYIEQMKAEEIARELNVSVNTVKVLRQRAKNQMREILRDVFPILAFLFLRA